MQIRCADCGCLPEECRLAESLENCPNCRCKECCCWTEIHDGLIR